MPSPPTQPRSAAALWLWLGLPVVWYLTLQCFLAHDPVARVLRLGADLAKERALQSIRAEWSGWFAPTVVRFIDDALVPYALSGQALMSWWALALGVMIPVGVALLAFVGLHLGLLLTGGAPGGWRATAGAVGASFFVSDLLALAWTWGWVVSTDSFVVRAVSLALGLAALRVLVLLGLFIMLAVRHRLGLGRIALLGVPTFLGASAGAALLAVGWWLWFAAGFALDVFRRA